MPLAVALSVSLATTTAWAIHPGQWVHTAEADFQPGEMDNTVVTNLGDVKLAHHTETLGETLADASIIYDLQELADGTLYIAAGPEAKLLRRKGDQTDLVLELKGEQVFCLDVSGDGRLLVAISGAKSRLAVLEGDELKELTPLPGVLYVWDMLVDGQFVYLATGTDGKLLRVDLSAPVGPAVSELLDTEQANLLCLGRDVAGRIYAGSDTDGLLYRVTIDPNPAPVEAPPEAEADAKADADAKTEAGTEADTEAAPEAPPLPQVGGVEVFVVYDADEPEIGALLIETDGTIYIKTADAQQARPGRLAKPATTENGRPEAETDAAPAPAAGQGEQPPAEGEQVAPPAAVEPGPDAQQQQQAPPAAAPKPAPLAGAAEPTRTPATSDGNGPAKAAPAAPAAPTAEQFEQLRQVTQQRLMEARGSGAMQVGGGHGGGRPTTNSAVQQRSTPPSQPPRKTGNAVYRISSKGFVDEVFRESVMILKLLDDDGKLLVATGNEGQIFSVDVAGQETAMLVDLKPIQVPAMVRNAKGEILLGTANPAGLVRLGRGYADQGQYTSVALDAAQISAWGQFNVTASVPQGTTLAIHTRSGNVADPTEALWSAWSEAVLKPLASDSPLAPRFARIASEQARFLQYRLTMTGSAEATPVVDRVDIAYVVPNLKPSIASIKATYPDQAGKAGAGSGSSGGAKAKGDAAPGTKLKLEWAAGDPNNDQLQYKLEYQLAGSGVWLTLEEDLDQNRYEWETRLAPNGRYTVRVTATDAPDNPPHMALTASRTSDPILIDNTAPELKTDPPRAAKVNGKTVVAITTTATDTLSPIQSVHYIVDGAEPWLVALPQDDLIYDSTSERIQIIIPDLAPGRHAITLRAIDGRGNATYQALFVDIKQGQAPQE